jgi:hypothetical protein
MKNPTDCWICHQETPEKKKNKSFGRPSQIGQICLYCFNTGFLPKYNTIRPPVVVCCECQGEGVKPTSPLCLIPGFKVCESCDGEKITRWECVECYQSTSMGTSPCNCGSSDGKLSPHHRRISLGFVCGHGKFAKHLQKHFPWCAAEKILLEVSKATKNASSQPGSVESTPSQVMTSGSSISSHSEQHHREHSTEQREPLLLGRPFRSVPSP